QNTTLVLNVVNWATVSVSLNQGSTITGGTVVFEVSDTLAGTNWFPLAMVPTGGSAAVSTYNLVASTNIAFQMNVAGFALMRVRLSSAILGSATVNVGIIGDSTATEYATVISGPIDGNGNVKVGVVGAVNNSQVTNRYASISASGVTGAAPTANTAIATLAVFDFYYEVKVIAGFGATAEATTVDNIELRVNGVAFATTPVVNAANTQSQIYTFYMNPGGAVNLTVNVKANASAGSIYKATIIATRLV
ncbi:MAG TPA: hypothetical protein VFK47_15315, partial [Ktedonobacteraceae bacterium]|nr:hypothetical protein [Ktedonobacteraceae bacterium]